jgi:hypothetical protein
MNKLFIAGAILASSMLFLSFVRADSCPKVRMQNVTKVPWTQHDRDVLVRAQKRCGELYPDMPCVKLFRKFGFQMYTVICGAQQ